MSFEKLLRNPIAVVILCLGALGMIYVNVISPIIKDKQSTAVETSDNISSPEIPAQTQPIEVLSTPAIESNDTLKPNELKQYGWLSRSKRDPFSHVNTLKQINKTSLAFSNFDSSAGSAANYLNKSSSSKPKKFLKAIANGTAGKVALVGAKVVREGDTCSLGYISRIDSNVVIIKNDRGIRVLEF